MSWLVSLTNVLSLKAMAQRTNQPKKTVEFVIKKAEVRISNQVKNQDEFKHYASGDYKDFLYAKQLTCPMKLTKPIKQLIKNCYSDIKKVLGHSVTLLQWDGIGSRKYHHQNGDNT